MSANTKTGTYRYDAKLGKVVKVSEDIPKKKTSQDGGPCCNCPHGCSH